MSQKRVLICFRLKNEGDSLCQRFLDGAAVVAQKIGKMLHFAAPVGHALLLLTIGNKYHDSNHKALPRREKEYMTNEEGQL